MCRHFSSLSLLALFPFFKQRRVFYHPPVLERDAVELEKRGAGEASAWTARNRRLEKLLVGGESAALAVDDGEEDAVAANLGPAASAEGAVQGRMARGCAREPCADRNKSTDGMKSEARKRLSFFFEASVDEKWTCSTTLAPDKEKTNSFLFLANLVEKLLSCFLS